MNKVSIMCVKLVEIRKRAKRYTNNSNYETRCRVICSQDIT